MKSLIALIQVMLGAATIAGCGAGREECRCVFHDDGVEVVVPSGWKGTGDNIKGSGPGCSFGGPAVSNTFSVGYHLIASGDGVCHVEITDQTGAVVYAEDTYVSSSGSKCCGRSYFASSVTLPDRERDSGPGIIVVVRPDGGDAEPADGDNLDAYGENPDGPNG